MKNLFKFLMAVAVLFTASCAKEDISSSIATGETVEVTFSANLTNLGSRATTDYGDGSEISTLRWFVYSANENGQNVEFLSDLSSKPNDPKSIAVNAPCTVNLVLIKGMKYNILFWADNGSNIYSIDNGVVSFDPEAVIMANDESRDAFYAVRKSFDPALATTEDTNVVLTRPFAQLNAIVTNMDDVDNSINLTTSTISTKIYTTLNPFAANETEVVGGLTSEPVTFTADYMDAENLASGHVSMNFLLAPAGGCLANVAFTFNNEQGVNITGTSYDNIPLKANYKTNIIGNLLTGSTDFQVEIKPGFNTPDEDIEVVTASTVADINKAIEEAPVGAGKSTEIILEGNINLGDLAAGLSSTRTANPDFITIPAGKEIVLDLNGYTLSGTDKATGSFGLINNKGTLTINDSKGNGKIQLTATENRGWNAYSSVISNQPGGVLVVNGGTIEHLGGTDMAYGIDNLTNGKNTSAVTTINGGTVKSTYRAVRQFLNGIEANNSLTVNGGTIEGANKSIWMQDPSAKANTGTLTVAAAAQLVGDVYLFVTAGSTEWPVSVSIAEAALQGESTVVTGNVPDLYVVKVVDGVWTVELAPYYKEGNTYYINNAEGLVTLPDIKAGDKFVLMNNIDLAGVEFNGLDTFHPENGNEFDGQGYTVSNWTNNSGASDMGFIRNWVGTIKNVNFENCHLKTSGRSAIAAAKVYGNIENVRVNNCSIEDSYWACGLIAGLYNAGSISNCSATNSSVKSNGGTGGIVGVINESAGTRSLTNCSVSNTTVNNTGAYGEVYSGALLCGMINISNSTVEFKGCSYENNTKEGQFVGDLYYAAGDDITIVVE